MNIAEINYLGIFLAAIASQFVGFLWFSPFLFGKKWMKLVGISEMKNDNKLVYGVTFIMSFITAYVLSVFIQFAQATTVLDGVLVGVLVWLGFIIPTSVNQVLFEKKSKELWLLNIGHFLTIFVVMAIILSLVK